MSIALTDEFYTLIDEFDSTANSLDLSQEASEFENSSGFAITTINRSIIRLNLSLNKIQELYSATSCYLDKARDNIDSCELDNTVS